jgi:hypothetical protein
MQFVNERIKNIPRAAVIACRYLYEQRKKERKRGRLHKRQTRGLIAFVAFFQLLNCDVKPPLPSKKSSMAQDSIPDLSVLDLPSEKKSF